MRGRASWVVLAIALAVRAWAASPPVLHDWDERYHALVAKHFIDHPLEPILIEGAGELPAFQWTATGVFLHKPPLALWLMALGRWVFGPSEWAFRVASVLLGVATTALTMWLGTEMLGAGVGLLAGMLVALQPELILLTSGAAATDHVDVQLTFWVTASAAAFWSLRRSPSVGRAALALGGGLLTKSWPALAVLPAAALVALPRRRRVVALIGITLAGMAIAAPWSVYAAHHWPQTYTSEGAYALRHLTEVLENHSGGPFFFLIELFRSAGAAGLIALGYGLWLARTREEARFLTAWLVVPLLIFSFAATKMTGYLAPELPALALLGAWLARDTWRWAEWRRGPAALAALVLAASVPLRAVGATAFVMPRALAVPEGYATFRERALHLGAGDRVFNARWYPQLMIYSDAWASSGWPTAPAGPHDWVLHCPQSPLPPAGYRVMDLPAGACER